MDALDEAVKDVADEKGLHRFRRGMQPDFARSLGQTPAAMGRVEGAVSVGVSSRHAFAAGATVRLSGPVVLETETDENGNYTFAAVASGTYRIEAFLSGLEAARTISVEAGKIVRTELQLKPADVKSSVTVTATAPETKDSAPSETISSKTLRDAPNANERFESALPLIPGVVRGPDGRINLKGARTTQSGALVNSANVTDPAPGVPRSTFQSTLYPPFR